MSAPAPPPFPSSDATTRSLYGLLAEYDSAAALRAAVARVREAGCGRWETYTPFPLPGVEAGPLPRPTLLPWVVLGAGAAGCAAGLALQYLANTVAWTWIVSGKPLWSWPAHVPIAFELTLLAGALAAFTGVLARDDLPRLSHPLDRNARFARATDDRFFLLVEADDAGFDAGRARGLLEETGPTAIEDVEPDPATPARLPRGVVHALLVLGAAAAVALGLVAQARVSRGRAPRLHLVTDMDFQPVVKAERAAPFFADGRGSRGALPGTVSREQSLDEHLTLGMVDGAPSRTFPRAVGVDRAAMEAGRRGFETYCAPCHGLAGNGDGMVARRADALAQGGGWVPPSSLNQDYVRAQPVGQLFASISGGIRTMPAYGHLLPPEDRWRILLYVRALERRAAAALADVPAAQRPALE